MEKYLLFHFSVCIVTSGRLGSEYNPARCNLVAWEERNIGKMGEFLALFSHSVSLLAVVATVHKICIPSD